MHVPVEVEEHSFLHTAAFHVFRRIALVGVRLDIQSTYLVRYQVQSK